MRIGYFSLSTKSWELQIRERLNAGYEGISAREVWQQLDGDLKTIRHTYRQVAKAIAAND